MSGRFNVAYNRIIVLFHILIRIRVILFLFSVHQKRTVMKLALFSICLNVSFQARIGKLLK